MYTALFSPENAEIPFLHISENTNCLYCPIPRAMNRGLDRYANPNSSPRAATVSTRIWDRVKPVSAPVVRSMICWISQEIIMLAPVSSSVCTMASVNRNPFPL